MMKAGFFDSDITPSVGMAGGASLDGVPAGRLLTGQGEGHVSTL